VDEDASDMMGQVGQRVLVALALIKLMTKPNTQIVTVGQPRQASLLG
jgi:hypothetical protein